MTSYNGANSSVTVFNYDETSNSYDIVGACIKGQSGTYYGESLALSAKGSRLAIGAHDHSNEESQSGKIFLFAVNNDNIVSIGGIYGEGAGDQSGWSVARSADGKRVFVGASDNGGGDNSGHVRVFESSPFL